jgi:peptidoglycan/LPS O-acetylase OafA/YrhL
MCRDWEERISEESRVGSTVQDLRVGSAVQDDRLAFLDVLRVAIIVMVIAHHAAQAYGPTGGNWPVTDSSSSDWFAPFHTVDAAVGLGLLFLLAGYLVPRSYDRKGPTTFLKQRWARIGVPLLVFAFAVHLPVVYLVSGVEPGELVGLLYEGGWQGLYLHLWVLGHLLLYTSIYAAWRKTTDRPGRLRRIFPPPTNATIAAFVVALTLVTWIIRWWYPIDEWVPLFFVLAAEPANLVQYVSLFFLGIAAYRNDWFRLVPTRIGVLWLGIGLSATFAIAAIQATGVWNNFLATGGASPRSLLLAGLGALVCTGLSVGLIVTARELLDRPQPVLAAMATASYPAYILHFWIVIGLQFAILALDLPAFVKFAAVTVLGVALSFGIGHVASRVPGVRVVFGARAATVRPPPG